MSNEQNPELNKEELRQKLNLETGKLTWTELQRHFARGCVITVSAKLDLIEVAACMVENEKLILEKWMNDALVNYASDKDATRWQSNNTEFWAIVIAPWVLVQETKHA